MQKAKDINQYLSDTLKKYNISLLQVSSNQICAAAAVIEAGKEFLIFLNTDIPETMTLLTVFHEIAHIKLGLIGRWLKKKHLFIEFVVNLFALMLLARYLPRKLMMRCLIYCPVEDNLYKEFTRGNKSIIIIRGPQDVIVAN